MTIDISDTNDEIPMFASASYACTITEKEAAGQECVTLAATDDVLFVSFPPVF